MNLMALFVVMSMISCMLVMKHSKKIMSHLRQRFLAGRVEVKSFKYLGFQINQENDKIILDHTDYVHSLRNLTMDPERAKQKHDILSIEEQTLYRKLVGQLNWVVQTSRPELSFEMVDLSTKLKKPMSVISFMQSRL